MLVQLMLARDREGRSPASAGQAGEPRVVVVIDELADLLMMAGKEARQALTAVHGADEATSVEDRVRLALRELASA